MSGVRKPGYIIPGYICNKQSCRGLSRLQTKIIIYGRRTDEVALLDVISKDHSRATLVGKTHHSHSVYSHAVFGGECNTRSRFRRCRCQDTFRC
jgi:hypothetical protein